MRKIPFTISKHFNNKRQQQQRNKTTNKYSSSSSSSSSLKDFRTESLRFAKIMGVVVFLFYVSWIPLAVSNFLNLQIQFYLFYLLYCLANTQIYDEDK